MVLKKAVRDALKMASWTMLEASYFVHNQPAGPKPSGTDNTAPARTYAWLKKEHKKVFFDDISDEDDIDRPRFSPGSILRRLDAHGKPFSREVYEVYLDPYLDPGPTQAKLKTRNIYKQAAKLIWDRHPTLPISVVAEALATQTELPGFLPPPGPLQYNTIRKHIKEVAPSGVKGNSGRPKGGVTELPSIDWEYVLDSIDPQN